MPRKFVMPRSTEEVVARYPALFNANATPEEHRHAMLCLQSFASDLRKRGVPEDQNHAATIVRQLGVKPQPKLFPVRRELGIADELQRIPAVTERELHALQPLVAMFGKAPWEISTEDVAAHLHAFERERSVKRMRTQRYLIFKFFEKARQIRPELVNPVVIPPRPRSLRIEELPEPLRADHELLQRRAGVMRFTPATQKVLSYNYRLVAGWLITQGLAEGGAAQPLWEEGVAEQLMRWWCEPRRGKLRSESAPPSLCTLLRNLWLAKKFAPGAVEDRVRAVRCSLRVDGTDSGDYTAVDLVSQDPPPAPSREQIAQLRQWYADEIASLRRKGRTAKLRSLLRERNAVETFVRTAIRHASCAALRFDQLVINLEENIAYFDNVLIKKIRHGREALVPERRVGGRVYSRWYIDPELLPMYEEELQLDGYSLIAYLEDHDRRHLPWVTVTTDDPYGDEVIGKEVSPVWRSPDGGYLRLHGLTRVVETVMRDRLELERGVSHPFRRRAVLDSAETARMYPEAVSIIHHMANATRDGYLRSLDRQPKLALPGSRSLRDILKPAQSEASAPDTDATPAKSRAEKKSTPPRASRPPRRRGPTFDELFGRSA